MIDFKILNDTYFLPQSWEETTWNQYADVAALQADDSLTENDRAGRILSILSGVSMDVIHESGNGLVVPLWKHLGFTLVLPEKKPIAHVTVNKTNYYAQKIDVFGELVLFDNIVSRYSDDKNKQIPYILALLLRKTIEVPENQTKKSWFKRLFSGNSDDNQPVKLVESLNMDGDFIEKRAKMFASSLNPVQVMGLAAFFLTSATASHDVSKLISSLPTILQTQNARFQHELDANTAGGRSFTTLKRIHQSIYQYYVKMLTK